MAAVSLPLPSTQHRALLGRSFNRSKRPMTLGDDTSVIFYQILSHVSSFSLTSHLGLELKSLKCHLYQPPSHHQIPSTTGYHGIPRVLQEACSALKRLSVNCSSRQDFPTPASPTSGGPGDPEMNRRMSQ